MEFVADARIGMSFICPACEDGIACPFEFLDGEFLTVPPPMPPIRMDCPGCGATLTVRPTIMLDGEVVAADAAHNTDRETLFMN